jgi:hypothetical protein
MENDLTSTVIKMIIVPECDYKRMIAENEELKNVIVKLHENDNKISQSIVRLELTGSEILRRILLN